VDVNSGCGDTFIVLVGLPDAPKDGPKSQMRAEGVAEAGRLHVLMIGPPGTGRFTLFLASDHRKKPR
jgi:hypothetical protein